jgi:hypothetical protein
MPGMEYSDPVCHLTGIKVSQRGAVLRAHLKGRTVFTRSPQYVCLSRNLTSAPWKSIFEAPVSRLVQIRAHVFRPASARDPNARSGTFVPAGMREQRASDKPAAFAISLSDNASSVGAIWRLNRQPNFSGG